MRKPQELQKQIENLIKIYLKQEVNLNKYRSVIISWSNKHLGLRFFTEGNSNHYFVVVGEQQIELYENQEAFNSNCILGIIELNPEEQKLAKEFTSEIVCEFEKLIVNAEEMINSIC
jgi:hypothetical protein